MTILQEIFVIAGMEDVEKQTLALISLSEELLTECEEMIK